MTVKYMYMKFIGLLTVIVGFGYCLTSFYNFFDVIFGNVIINASANLIIMGIGLIFPLIVFFTGLFFYFYADVYNDGKNIWVLVSAIILIFIGILKALLTNDTVTEYLSIFKDLMGFTHVSFAYISLILGILLIYGRIKFKY